jgi:hypothetical protein
MSNAKYGIIACIVAAQAAGSAASAQNNYTYLITADTYIDSSNPNTNYGAYGYDKIVDSDKPASSPSQCRTLFDLPSTLWSLPSSDILSATVSFYTWNDNTGRYSNDVSLIPLTRAFGVGTGNGKTLSVANGATWLTYDGTNSWTTPGADFDPATNSVPGVPGPVGSQGGTNFPDSNGRFFTFNIMPLLTNSTTEDELQNYGAMLSIDIGNALPATNVQYYAAFISADNTNYAASYLPSIDLTVIPEPSSLLLVALGTTATACFLRKRPTQR